MELGEEVDAMPTTAEELDELRALGLEVVIVSELLLDPRQRPLCRPLVLCLSGFTAHIDRVVRPAARLCLQLLQLPLGPQLLASMRHAARARPITWRGARPAGHPSTAEVPCQVAEGAVDEEPATYKGK